MYYHVNYTSFIRYQNLFVRGTEEPHATLIASLMRDFIQRQVSSALMGLLGTEKRSRGGVPAALLSSAYPYTPCLSSLHMRHEVIAPLFVMRLPHLAL